jgi:hypothetical protein
VTIDSFYTSAELADTLISFAKISERPNLVADFACGEGSLLLAAERRWPGVKVLANDLSRAAIHKLKRARSEWQFASVNFLEHRSIRSSRIRDSTGVVDLVVLNPPFSWRDKKTHPVEFDGKKYNVSVATAFVVNCVPFISERGSLLAVLPDGCLVNNTDAPVWRELRTVFKFEIIRDNARSAFQGVSARTCLIRMSRINDCKRPVKADSIAETPLVKVERGSCQMHARSVRRSESSGALVHTSHLRGGLVVQSGEVVFGKTVEGPAVLFPRVGRVTPEKVCFLERERRVVLSDCVLAVPCSSVTAGLDMRAKILGDWSNFAACYRGTGAPYITIERATHVLSKIMALQKAKHSKAVRPSKATRVPA